MADLAVRRGNGGGELQQALRMRDLEPLRMFRDLLNWDPFQAMAPVWRRIPQDVGLAPDFDVKETKDAYCVEADVPGLKEDDVDVSVTGSRLTISGKREQETEERTDTYYTCERSFGSFSRSFTLPDGADTDNIQAELASGVLAVTIPKRPEVQPKKVSVKGSSERSAIETEGRTKGSGKTKG